MEKEKMNMPSQATISEPVMWIFAGVEGAGKTSMMGPYGCLEGIMMETTLTDADIHFIMETSHNHFTRMIYIGLDALEEHLARIENRVRKGGASADPEAVKEQFEHRFETLVKVMPFCNEVCFYDNDNGFRCVGSYREKKMTVKNTSCSWYMEYLAKHYINTGLDIMVDEKIDRAVEDILSKHRRALKNWSKRERIRSGT